MNKLLNWTFGSFFRTFGRVFAYILLGVLFYFVTSNCGFKITDLLGIEKVKASEINSLELKKFYVADVTENPTNPEQQWSSAIDWGIEYNRTSETSLYLRSIRVRAGYSSKFLKGVTYKFKINVIYSNSINGQFYKLPDTILCQGSGTSSWSSDTDLISSCKFIGREFYNNKANASYIFEFVPSADIYGIQIAWYYKLPVYNNYDMAFASVGKIRVLNSSKITYDNSTNDAINSMSDNITINQNKNTEDIINNNNENTDKINNTINNQLGDKCSNLFDVSKFVSGTLDNSNGSVVYSNLSNITGSRKKDGNITFNVSSAYVGVVSDYVSVVPSSTYYLKFSNSDYYPHCVYYDNNKNFLSVIDNQYTLNTTNNTKYIRCAFVSSSVSSGTHNIGKLTLNDDNNSFCEFGSYSSKLDNVNNSINNLTDSLTDETPPNVSGLENAAGWLPPGPLDSVLNLPLSIMQSINNKLNGTCSPLVITIPFIHSSLPIPCVSTIYSSISGLNSFLDFIGSILAAIILYNYFVYLYTWVDDVTSLKHNKPRLFGAKSDVDNWGGVD